MDYDARDLLVSSDYPLDKVIGGMSGSRNVPAFDNTISDLPHGFSFRPLALTMYSFEPSFNSAKDEGIAQFGDPNDLVAVISYTDTGNLRLAWANNTASSRVVYWRTYFFMPSNVAQSVGFTGVQGDDFIVNSDYNYTKLYQAGLGTNSFSVEHNLGYLPQVIAWGENAIGLGRITTGGAYPNYPDVRVNETSVLFRGSGQVHYRIYIDE